MAQHEVKIRSYKIRLFLLRLFPMVFSLHWSLRERGWPAAPLTADSLSALEQDGLIIMIRSFLNIQLDHFVDFAQC